MFYPSSDERFTANSFEEVRPLLLRSMFWRPSYLAMSAWLDHIPFAFWLIEAHRPRTLVELGTHYGASYFAFCQAVDRLGLDTSCYAVDTWKGDEHAGFYGEDVAQAVRAHNDANYSGFSRLVRSTFDEALEHFSDGTIDLLHIDGLHTAEAVAHDFESWRPKLSDEAVVLFHDTNVRERGFGVFKFFERIREEHPAFEFIHGHGLGVLGVGRRQKPLLRRLFDASRDIASRQAIREIFGRLGRNCSIAHAARHDGKRKKSIEAELAKMRSSLASAKSALEAREAKAAEQAQAFEAERARLLARVADLEATIAERFREIATLSRLLSDKEKDADLADSSAKGLAERLTTLQDSTVWKAAAQVNRVISPLGGGRRQLRRQRRLVEASGLFDRDWYLKENPDVAANGADPLDHFLLFGGQEGRAPSRSFDSGAYLRANTDVAEAGVNPLVHYLIHGRSEGRQVAAVR